MRSRSSPVSTSLFTFFRNSFSQPPAQAWWESHLSQFPKDIQNLIEHLKSMPLPSSTATLNGPSSKRIHVEKPEEKSEKLSMESSSILDSLKSFKPKEMTLYLLSFNGKQEVMETALSPALAAYFDSIEEPLESNAVWRSVKEIMEENEEFGIELLSACRSSSSVLDWLVIVDWIRGVFREAFRPIGFVEERGGNEE